MRKLVGIFIMTLLILSTTTIALASLIKDEQQIKQQFDITSVSVPATGERFFQKTYGGIGDDRGRSVQQTRDGGYIITGITGSYGDSHDVYLIKIDPYGNEEWYNKFGNWWCYDEGYQVQQTNDDGYIIAGYTESFGAGSLDGWLIKTNKVGREEWNNTYGGPLSDGFRSVQVLPTTPPVIDEFILCGFTQSFSNNMVEPDAWLLMVNRFGNFFNKTFGGDNYDMGNFVQQTSDGGFVVVGYSNTWTAGKEDVYFFKTNSGGNWQWQHDFGEGERDEAWCIREDATGYILTGFTKSRGAGGYDVWLIKCNSTGSPIWDKTFGGTNNDYGYSVQCTTDGGYIIVGQTESFGHGSADVYLIKTDKYGNEMWNRTFGGADAEGGYSVQQTTDGGYVIVGYTVSFGHGGKYPDVYLIRTNSNGRIKNKSLPDTQIITDSSFSKNIAINTPIIRFIKIHPILYQLLQRFLKI